MEYQANTKQIKVEMARQFRYSWVQGQQLLEYRFVRDLDDYDDELGFDPVGYELFQVGTDVLGAAPNVASSIGSPRPVLGYTGFTSLVGFSTCAGPTLEAVPDLFDDAS
ncbi:hypothetical protein L3X38_012082 [Prunus dulcis]|uniref:Uncharacterized protein n=1 Tax=Prunus dulcis TaxID=3755 RepID=A0AAD4WIS4_PRUDU|nr:hypothetical protein L3X38_012082 [Prunus dulcis]